MFSVGFFGDQVDVRFDVAADGAELLIGAELLFRALAITQDELRGILIAPEIGIGDAGFQRFQTFTILFNVKESSARG